jgi:hypothetical protein
VGGPGSACSAESAGGLSGPRSAAAVPEPPASNAAPTPRATAIGVRGPKTVPLSMTAPTVGMVNSTTGAVDGQGFRAAARPWWTTR